MFLREIIEKKSTEVIRSEGEGKSLCNCIESNGINIVSLGCELDAESLKNHSKYLFKKLFESKPIKANKRREKKMQQVNWKA